jgi:formamidopyrimidine-DNA glycosylase
VGRRGKQLLLGFGDLTFIVHLMQGGRLRPDEKQTKKPRGGMARWTFADGRALLLTEAGTEKRAGVWVVEGNPRTQEPLDHLGPDADEIDAATLAPLLADNSMRLHGFLRDQRLIAGLGRRLANEICHRAQLSPFASTAKLDGDEIDRLVVAIHECIDESLAFERDRDDMSSSKERPGAVHHRTGEACQVCGDQVRSVEYTKYTVNYCATCQTGGKVLADNTTSKFLK